MALILSLETSTKVCSVAIHENGRLLADENLKIDKSHSSHLTMVVDKLTEYVGLTLNNFDAIAVSMGPGSYTGLRIGVSTAKGYCYALDKPLIAVNALEGMARSIADCGHQADLLCPMIDARRMEVYATLVKGKEILEKTQPVIIDESSFMERLEAEKVFFFGDGAEKCKSVIKHENAVFIDDVFTNARGIGAIAFERFEKEQFEDVAYFEPFYLKEFQTKPSKKKLL